MNQALAGKFNAHVHVEYEWCLQHEDLDESDEDLDEKVRRAFVFVFVLLQKKSAKQLSEKSRRNSATEDEIIKEP